MAMSRSALQIGPQTAPNSIFLAPISGVRDLPFRGLARQHVEAMLSYYGIRLGVRKARKRIGWHLESSGRAGETVKAWRPRLRTDDNAGRVLGGLDESNDDTQEAAA